MKTKKELDAAEMLEIVKNATEDDFKRALENLRNAPEADQERFRQVFEDSILEMTNKSYPDCMPSISWERWPIVGMGCKTGDSYSHVCFLEGEREARIKKDPETKV